ncbi:uncharacterized protein K452DRAFT_232770 [Aplosporella prunicola CBS 121167]|uniref:Uncharacterized protein n=1 Tax=Aplosporella prunicola CBS 121167 TaxID=1176127 RepID=A0A6A6B7Q1_9PEZI|nr:uncharacterized protein K452DRAFT_232770 [Aplosporella prunicola CBS 121167]KAF2139244.1 hypothetical protein K452DRAFT_232770 [Aplosporella prunicola CBS 121167]
MSAEYQGQNPLDIAKQAEQDLNSHRAKWGHDEGYDGNSGRGAAVESGVDARAAERFPGGSVTIGSAASGAGGNREIPFEEGGDIQKGTGRPTKARDFEGFGGPEDKARAYAKEQGGADSVRGNIRQ